MEQSSSTEQINERSPNTRPGSGLGRRRHRPSWGRIIIGIVILLLGIYFLAKNTGWIPADMKIWGIVWPCILIVAGIMLILKRRRRHP